MLVSIRFQILFHSPPGVLFTFPSRYYSLSVTKSYLALEGGPPCFPPDFSCPVVLWYQLCLPLSTTGLSPSLACFSNTGSSSLPDHVRWPATPKTRRFSVWAIPFSLATTQRIVFTFFSSGYLDVSVHRVPSLYTMYSCMGDEALPPPGFPIRTSTDHRLLAAPRGVSPLAASFIGAWCQGIRPVLFLA